MKYLFYNEYLKNRNTLGKDILVAKTRNSYLIGPKINENFLEDSFYLRVKSNSIYKINIYKKIRKSKLKKLEKLNIKLNDNEVIELYKDGSKVIHQIIEVPRSYSNGK